MTAASAAQPGSALAFDRFLRTVERPAIRIAELGEELHPRAVEHVARAMADLGAGWAVLPESQWPVEFWRRLQRRLDRSRGNAPARAFERLAAHEDEPAPDDDPLAGEDAAWHLESALRALSTPQRLSFLLRVWEGMELASVAQALDMTPDVARTELFHALQRLHARLAPGATDRRWVLRCRGLLDEWAGQIESPSLAPLAMVRRTVLQAAPPAAEYVPAPPRDWVRRLGLAALLTGAAVLGWRGWQAWRTQPAVMTASVAELPAAAPPAPLVELAPVAAPDYELLADEEQYEVLRDLDFYAWYAREHAVHE